MNLSRGLVHDLKHSGQGVAALLMKFSRPRRNPNTSYQSSITESASSVALWSSHVDIQRLFLQLPSHREAGRMGQLSICSSGRTATITSTPFSISLVWFSFRLDISVAPREFGRGNLRGAMRKISTWFQMRDIPLLQHFQWTQFRM